MSHQEFVVHGLDDDFLGGVLRHVESQFQHFVVTLVLNQRTVESVQPGARVVLRAQRAVLARGVLRGRTEISRIMKIIRFHISDAIPRLRIFLRL